MKNWWEELEKVPVVEEVPICNADGTVRETVKVEVVGRKGPDGEIHLVGEALEKIEQVKARYEGIMLPTDIRRLRERCGLSQNEMCNALGLGKKTWTRWETGRERPSRSMNNMLVFLYNGKLTLEDFEHVAIQEEPVNPRGETRNRVFA